MAVVIKALVILGGIIMMVFRQRLGQKTFQFYSRIGLPTTTAFGYSVAFLICGMMMVLACVASFG